ncbi:MAG: polyprenol monophosphomannose synthase [Solirubrobacteraceae bacterium]
MSGPAWLILPTFQEAENIEQVVRAATAELAGAGVPFHVLVVDDSSPDGTGEIAERLAVELGEVSVLHRPRREGLGPAYLAGFAQALAQGADLVLEMDADFSHNPADLPRLIAAVRAGADLALGSRYVAGGGVSDWGLTRRIVSRAGCIYARAVLGLGVRDLTGGFKCFRREVLEAIELETVRSAGYAFQVEVTNRAIKHGFCVVEVPIVFRDRLRGRSKMSPRIALEAFWMLPQLRFGRSASGPPSR